MATAPLFRRGITLYDYQLETLARIISAERTHDYASHEGLRALGHIPLTEPFGSGKTFIILALITRVPIPPPAPVFLYTRMHHGPFAMLEPDRANQIVRPTAIVVARSVYAQWARNIETYTSLRAYEARDKISTRRLIGMLLSGAINDYDVVLIKRGKTAAVAAATRARDDAPRELCEMITRGSAPLIWARVVYDDVDLIANSGCMRAISSIFVTGATDFEWTQREHRRAKLTARECAERARASEIAQDLPRVSHIFSNARSDAHRKIWAQMGHSPHAIARDHGVYAMQWLRCEIANGEIHRASRLIANADADSEELLRMINSDSMTSAARLLGISVATPSAMFASVLGAQREEYATLRARADIFARLDAIGERGRVELRAIIAGSREGAPQGSAIIAEPRSAEEAAAPLVPRVAAAAGIDCAIIAIAGRAVRDGAGVDPLFDANAVIMAGDDENARARAAVRDAIARLDRSFERIRENMAEQTCQICYFALNEGDDIHVAIMRCCGFIMCSQCCARASRFARQGSDIIGHCAQCRSAINIARDVIFVENGSSADDLMRLARDEGCSERAVAHPPPARDSIDEVAVAVAARITTKTEYIVALVSGKTIGACVRVREMAAPTVPGVMNGTQMVGGAPSIADRRFIICADFDEMIEDLAVALGEAAIPFAALNGTAREFASTIASFAGGDARVLIVNTRALFAGVDLQMATDMIIVDAERTANLGQIVGRAQRLGRTCSLVVHYLEYCAPS